MPLKITATCCAEDGSQKTVHCEYTDSPFLDTAIRRAKEMVEDYYTWAVPEKVRWTKVSFEVEVTRE